MAVKKFDWRYLIAALFFISLFLLIFVRLGFYPFFDDEANTAIFAHGILTTGDTSAIFGHNIWGYRNGLELNADLKNRLVAPLGYYVTAPFLALFGSDAFFARLPFAIASLITIAVVILWLFQIKASLKTFILTWLGFLGNISFILFSRQCRYYALAMLFSLLTTYFYLYQTRHKTQRNTSWRATFFLTLSLILLLSSHYLAYAGMACALALDFLLWGRHHHPFSRVQLFFILICQLIAGYFIVSTWYPLGKNIDGLSSQSWLIQRFYLVWLNLRDINSAEFISTFMLYLAPLIYFMRQNRSSILLRLPVGLAIILIVVALFSPQLAEIGNYADVRYLSFALPGFIFLSVVTIENLPLKNIYQYLFAILFFFSTLPHIIFSAFTQGPPIPFRSTFFAYLHELYSPPSSACEATIKWINKYTKPGETAFVQPSFSMYPLMYHAPRLIYGWQFNEKARIKFPHLPAIQYIEQVMPTYIVFFGYTPLTRSHFIQHLKNTYHVNYVQVATLNISIDTRSRPEMFWHSFYPVTHFNIDREGVYIFKAIHPVR